MKFCSGFRRLGFVIAVLGSISAAGAVDSVQRHSKRRVINLEIQRAVRTIKPYDVKEICFLAAHELPSFPQESRPAITGPVTSRKEISEILHAFSGSTHLPGLPGDDYFMQDHQAVWIGLKNGYTLIIPVNCLDGPYESDYAAHFGDEVARLMMKHRGSSLHAQAVADGLSKKRYAPWDVAPSLSELVRFVERPDGRYENTAMQKSARAIAPTDVKEICFTLHGNFPKPLPRVTGPVTSTKEIQRILHAFAHASSKVFYDESVLYVDHEDVWIGLKNGKTLLLEINGYPDEYEPFYGPEVAQLMREHSGSCSVQQVHADKLEKHVYRTYDVALAAQDPKSRRKLTRDRVRR